MQILLLIVVALVIVILTELVKRLVTWRPETIAAILSVLAVIGQAAQRGQPPDLPAFVNGLIIYITASLGYDKVLGGAKALIPLKKRE